MPTLFVSHCHADREWVKPLVGRLREAGWVVLIDFDGVQVGDAISAWVQESVEMAGVAVVCWSEAAKTSAWVQAERRFLAARLKRVVMVERAEVESEEGLGRVLDRIAPPVTPMLLAASGDEDRANEVAQALGPAPAKVVPGVTEAETVRAALVNGQPLVLLWSARAAGDAGLRRLMDAVLAEDLRAWRRRLYVHRIDGTPFDVLYADIRAADSADLANLRQILTGVEEQRLPPLCVPRPKLEAELGLILRQERQLLLLAPRRGGARTLVGSLVAQSGFGDRVTELFPPDVSDYTSEQFFAGLTGDDGVTSTAAYHEWQIERAKGRPHLIVLRHDGCPAEHLKSLAEVLRALLHRTGRQFSVLVAGKAQAAELKREALENSIFSGMPTKRVPELAVDEVRQIISTTGGSDAERLDRLAVELHRATGGHPGLLDEVLSTPGPLGGPWATELLYESAQVRGILEWRLAQDDRSGEKERHAGRVLRRLVEAGEKAETERGFKAIEFQLKFGETRLYYDGLLRPLPSGKLTFRCEAVWRVAKDALEVWEEPA